MTRRDLNQKRDLDDAAAFLLSRGWEGSPDLEAIKRGEHVGAGEVTP